MRDKIEWAKKHRNGLRRANAIIDRQDNKPPLPTPGKPVKQKNERSNARRLRQLQSGYLKTN